MNLKDFFTVKLIARNLNNANIQTFHHEFIIRARNLWRHFFMNLKTKFWRISKIFYSQTSCSKAEFLQIFKFFIMNLSLEQESSEVTAFLWIWKPNFDEFHRFFTVKPLARKPNFLQILKLFIMNLSLDQESSEVTVFLWIWKTNFDEFQRFFTVKPLARNLNFCKYSNFSWWINHYSNEGLKAFFYDSESQNLTIFKVKPLARNWIFVNIETFHVEFVITSKKLWRRFFFTNLKGKIWRISKIFTLKLLAVMMNICKNEGGYSINPVQGQKNVFFDHPWWILHFWTWYFWGRDLR